MKHTPGPWKINGSCHIREVREDVWVHEPIISVINDFDPSPGVASVYSKEYRSYDEAHRPDPATLANARLIAAAPELLEALERLVRHASIGLDASVTHDGLGNMQALAQARAAIEKATN